MSSVITLDFETYYDREYSLSKITTDAYVRSPQFQFIGLGVKVDDGPVDWFAGPDTVARYVSSVDWSDTFILCQNTAFDGFILSHHFGVKPKGWLDTLGMSRALFPHEKSHSLAAQTQRLGFGAKGDEVLNALGKRYEDFTPEQLDRYGDYCRNDVFLTHQLFMAYLGRGFPKGELQLIDITLRMFTEPVLELDADMLVKHLAEVRSRKQALMENVRDNLLANADPSTRQTVFEGGLEGVRTLLMSNVKFAEALRGLGVEPPMKISPTTGKETYAFAKSDEAFKALEEHPSEEVQTLVSARLGTKSTIEETRTETLIGYAARGLFPIALRYYGAHTGRWAAESSAKVNMQNLPRNSPIKNAIVAPEGYVLCGADLSNIELRLGLWLAGQDDRVAMLARGLDLYKDFSKDVFGVLYEEVTKEQRQVGKVSNLSLIYGTGPAKLREALRIMGGVVMTLEQVNPIVQLYRERYAKVKAAWKIGDDALHALVNKQRMEFFRGTCRTEPEHNGIRLPNGLHIQYPGLRRVTNAEGKAEWVFDSKNGPERIYGSKVFQGCTQAIARCIMADGLRRLQKHSPVRLTIHDSAYWLALEHEAQASLDRGIACITAPVPYAPGLPLAAEGSFGKSLADC